MRTVALKKRTRGIQTSTSKSIAAPTGGWNARDSLADMEEKDAIVMDNIFPLPTDVLIRKGYSEHTTGLSGQVESLMPYNEPDGTQTLFCAEGTDFFNVTAAGAVGAAVQSSLANARWQHDNFTNSSGTTYLTCFNGADSPRYWDGSSWTTITDVSSPGITGLTTSEIIGSAVHKRRMWLVQTGSMQAWYLPVDSVGGLAKSLDLSGIAYKGGYIMSIGTWTLDAGEGVDDYWVAVTSEGQVAVYKGTDPSSSALWALVGVWNIGEPIGRRCLMKYRGDLLLICVDGVFPLSAALLTAQTDPSVAITFKISSAMTSAAMNYKANYGWETLFFAQANMVLLNVPTQEGSSQEQYAMNTITGSWGGPFKGVSANCWCIFNQEPYFGGSTIVGKFWDTYADNGENIDFDMQQAFSYFGSKRLKQFRSVRPNVLSNSAPSVLVGINVDFQNRPLAGTASFSPGSSSLWDTAMWDSGQWSGGLDSYTDWQTVQGVGISAALRMKGAINGTELHLAASDHLFEYGGVIG